MLASQRQLNIHRYHYRAIINLSRTMAVKNSAVFSPEIPAPLTRQDYMVTLFHGLLCTAVVQYIQTWLPGKVQPGYSFDAAPRTTF
ncbi:unnamed protein product [Periconia digitata]|uniref:Uncharacterized protein n=1 Tax=Periconia digitata TaxID=1303443 RepID=A0A9W4XKM4_9PLEO|nr:unnamed protein product [Periconia digitata]